MSATIVAAPAIHSETIPSRNRNLQWLRAAAAVSVLLCHASWHLRLTVGFADFTQIFGADFGLLGVAIFFAISGALMADIARKTSAADFLLHRILRIYPIFILAFATLQLLNFEDYSFRFQVVWLAPIGNVERHRLGVEWTLIFELFYYVLLFLALASGLRRRIEWLAVGWLALLLVAAFTTSRTFQNDLEPTFYLMPFYAANIAFAGGLLIPWLARRNVFQPAIAAPAVACATVVMSVDVAMARLLGSVAAVLLVGLTVAPHVDPAARDGFFGRILTRLGDCSYALYLCHVPIQLWIFRTVEAPPEVLWVLAVAVPILVSVPLGILDLRIYRFLRARCNRLRPEQARFWAWSYFAAYAAIAVWFTFFDR